MNNLYDEITQIDLNTLIYRMIDFIKFEVPLNLLTNLENKYCKIRFDLDDPSLSSKYNNIVSGDEIIIGNSFNINLSDLSFSTLKYYIQFDYYKLDTDINDSNNNTIIIQPPLKAKSIILISASVGIVTAVKSGI